MIVLFVGRASGLVMTVITFERSCELDLAIKVTSNRRMITFISLYFAISRIQTPQSHAAIVEHQSFFLWSKTAASGFEVETVPFVQHTLLTGASDGSL